MSDIEKRLWDTVKKTAEEVNEIEEPQDLDILAAEVTTDMLHHIQNIVLLTASGGPQIEVDLGSEKVRGYWGKNKTIYPVETQKAERLWSLYAARWEAAE